MRVHELYGWVLHDYLLFFAKVEEQNKTEIWYLHIPVHQPHERDRAYALYNLRYLEKMWTKGVQNQRKETQKNEVHWISLDVLYQAQQEEWWFLIWRKKSVKDSWKKELSFIFNKYNHIVFKVKIHANHRLISHSYSLTWNMRSRRHTQEK